MFSLSIYDAFLEFLLCSFSEHAETMEL